MTSLRQILLPTSPSHRVTDYRHNDGEHHRPIWRGRQHALTLILITPALIWLLLHTFTQPLPALQKIAVIIYTVSLVAVLAISTTYHVFTRTPRSQLVMQRIDRATIYALIAGTYTPIILLLVPTPYSVLLLILIWAGAITGIVFRSIGILPRTAGILYVALGWVALLLAPTLWNHSIPIFLLIITGGIAFTVGAILFAFQRPRLSPTHFGFHEVFHSFTLAGFTLHYLAITLLLLTIT